MKKLIFLFFSLLFSLHGMAAVSNISSLYSQLEKALKQRTIYMTQKEERIDSICQLVSSVEKDDVRTFGLYKAIYSEYITYQFDSAMHYLRKAEILADRMQSVDRKNMCIINRAYLLATGGYFHEAIELLDSIPHETLAAAQLPDYYRSYEWAYSGWGNYADESCYAQKYRQKEMLYMDSILSVLPPASNESYYWKAELEVRQDKYQEADADYRKALEGLPMNQRLYASTACGLALVNGRMKRWEQYEYYMILSAISDQYCALKENLSLQELAIFIFHNRESEAAQANRYLNYALDDAAFYGNRLRLMEIARKLPGIVQAYEKQNKVKNIRLMWTLGIISVLGICLLGTSGYIYHQMKLLRKRKQELSRINEQLACLNKQLLTTNENREKHVSMFLELCAAYIDKLDKYQNLVKRKVKAKQAEDLLQLKNTTKMTDADAKEFFLNFDKAFVALYPHFIDELNALLRDGEQLISKKGEVLSTELRIFALIRLGIKDSSKIATLLFYSPQTIYNYRCAVKNKAISRDDFERQVEELCTVIHE